MNKILNDALTEIAKRYDRQTTLEFFRLIVVNHDSELSRELVSSPSLMSATSPIYSAETLPNFVNCDTVVNMLNKALLEDKATSIEDVFQSLDLGEPVADVLMTVLILTFVFIGIELEEDAGMITCIKVSEQLISFHDEIDIIERLSIQSLVVESDYTLIRK